MGCANTKPQKKEPIANPYAKIHRQIKKDEDEAKPLKLEDMRIPDSLKVSARDFEIGSYLQEGGMGKVYAATRKKDGRRVALKLFGYTKRLATPDDIQHEIDLMAALKGVEGFIQTEGVFWDTEEGIVSDAKLHRVACPVIVMELMEGGELFDRMHALKEVSEKYIARIFKSIVVALDSMHKKGFVHRDFKLENAMMVTMAKDSPVRIIDFGMVCKIPSYTGSYRGSAIQGTPGYIAPESIMYHQYSAKTDLWQAGCTLYSLLSGLLPYNRDDYEQVTHHKYYPMKGVGWDNISAEAKDLVRRILTRRPESRITAEQILQHPWIVSEAPDVKMGDDYFARIKQLALRQKLKCFFLDSRLEERNQVRKNQLQLLLPFLATSSTPQTPAKKNSTRGIASLQPFQDSAGGSSSPVPSANSCEARPLHYDHSNPSSTGSLVEKDGVEIQNKLKHLKDIIIPSLSSNYSSDNLADMSEEDSSLQVDTSANNGVNQNDVALSSSTPKLKKSGSTSSANRIDYAAFESMMNQCGLPELASQSVFKIFDLTHCGYIDLKDFLLTMIAFREDADQASEGAPPATTEAPRQHSGGSLSPHGSIHGSIHGSNHSGGAKRTLRRRDSMQASEEAVRLYFNVFDYKETGFIDKEELRTVVACILQDQAENDLENNMGSMSFNVEDLFDIIDVKKNGRIDYEEFKQFYQAVLTNTNTRRSIILDDDSSSVIKAGVQMLPRTSSMKSSTSDQ